MGKFGIFPQIKSDAPDKIPNGYFRSDIFISDHVERVASNSYFWTPEMYVESWRRSSRRLLKNENFACFVSSLEKGSTDVWLGENKANCIVMINLYVSRADLIVEGLDVSLSPIAKKQIGEEVKLGRTKLSTWTVDRSLVSQFSGI